MTPGAVDQPSSHEEIVVLVHGTFAGDPSDVGPRWWQRGSDTWNALSNLLPTGICMGPVFHWENGPNSARGRLAAARILLDKILSLESQNTGYHLIGHSHGGSVIVQCLQQAVLERRKAKRNKSRRAALQLNHLRSWTTMGTPFMQYELLPISDLPFMGWYNKLSIKNERRSARLPFLMTLESFMMVPPVVLMLATLIYAVVSLGFSDFQNIWPVLLLTGICLALLFIVVFLGGLESRAERLQFHRENDCARQVAIEFGPRWLGLVSPDDEAIAALRNSVDIKLKLMRRHALPNKVFYSDRVVRWKRPFKSFVYRLYNRTLPPLGDRLISRRLRERTQGNDRPGVQVHSVSTSPIPSVPFSFPLPDKLATEISDLANERARSLIPELRRMVGAVSTSGYQVLQREFGGVDLSEGLVHNSYFLHEDLLKLIVWRISRQSSVVESHDACVCDEAYVEWASEYTTYLEEQLQTLVLRQ